MRTRARFVLTAAIPMLAAEAAAQFNPRKVTAEDLARLYRSAL